MAIKPAPDRSDLESKTREDLQTIAKVKGVDAPARATKAVLIEAIMSDLPDSPDSPDSSGAQSSRAVRSRRTVATPDDDFDELLGEFVADAKPETTSPPASVPGESVPVSERSAPRQFNQPRTERQPRESATDNRNGFHRRHFNVRPTSCRQTGFPPARCRRHVFAR